MDGFLYTDMKPENVLWRRTVDGQIETVFCDFSGARSGRHWVVLHDVPIPENHRVLLFHASNYERTISPPSKEVVWWSFAVCWLILLGHESIA